MSRGTLAVIAKAPAPGAVKTRLCPPLSPRQAAELARSALGDTLAAMAAASADRKVLVLNGRPGAWPDGFEVISQRGSGLDERLAAAFDDLTGPTLIIGMDTPQVSAELLELALGQLERYPAVLGPAEDGGYWGIGLRRADQSALLGVPMSSPHTLTAQRIRLRALGLSIGEVATLRDVDTFDDAMAVAAAAPATRFARALRELSLTEAAV